MGKQINMDLYLRVVGIYSAFHKTKEAHSRGDQSDEQALATCEQLVDWLEQLKSEPEFIVIPDPKEIAWEVWQKTDGVCSYCSTKLNPFDRRARNGFHIDHVIPRVQGGTSAIENLVPACAKCNGDKGGRTPEEWRAGNVR